MYTRSMYQTADMARQGEIPDEVAKLVDNGVVESSLSETLHGLSVESITEAHRKVLEGICVGRWWLSIEWTDSLTRPLLKGEGD